MVASAIALGYFLLALDEAWHDELLEKMPKLADVSADGIRSLISTAATAVLSLAGITFSGTLVALTLASSQFGPRLLRNFIRSRANQFTLATLLSTFVYCLVVLRGIRDSSNVESVPHIAAFAGFVGTLTSLATFIFFIHHISTSLQADRIAAAVYAELKQGIERIFPESRPTDDEESQADDDSESWDELKDETPIDAPQDGYLQAIDIDTLVDISERLKLRCRVLKRPGHFLTEGTPAIAIEGETMPGEDDLHALRRCLLLGPQRTAEQDFEFEIRQLVEIALRALSPGINDPFTAITCIDFLGAGAAAVARRRLPQRIHRDSGEVARVRTRPVTFDSILDASFHQLRQIAAEKPDIVVRLLEVLATVDRRCLTNEQRNAVRKHVLLIEGDARKAIRNPSDIREMEQRLEAFDFSDVDPSTDL